MIFADTSVWIDYFNGVMAPHTEILDFDPVETHLGLKIRVHK